MWTESEKQYSGGRGRDRESPGLGLVSVPMVTGGGGVSGRMGSVFFFFAGVTGFLLEREVVAELAAVMMTSAVFESTSMSWKVELSNINLGAFGTFLGKLLAWGHLQVPSPASLQIQNSSSFLGWEWRPWLPARHRWNQFCCWARSVA